MIRCMSCLRIGPHAPDCLDRTTMTSVMPRVLAWTGVMEAVQKPAEPRSRIPVWTLAAIVWGSVLMVLGLMLNGPVSELVWRALQHVGV